VHLFVYILISLLFYILFLDALFFINSFILTRVGSFVLTIIMLLGAIYSIVLFHEIGHAVLSMATKLPVVDIQLSIGGGGRTLVSDEIVWIPYQNYIRINAGGFLSNIAQIPITLAIIIIENYLKKPLLIALIIKNYYIPSKVSITFPLLFLVLIVLLEIFILKSTWSPHPEPSDKLKILAVKNAYNLTHADTLRILLGQKIDKEFDAKNLDKFLENIKSNAIKDLE